jgi:hypothetical protein
LAWVVSCGLDAGVGVGGVVWWGVVCGLGMDVDVGLGAGVGVGWM